jgi:predicted dehydrogenase
LSRGGPGLDPAAERATRVSIGHPEGFHEAFANLYADAAEAVAARLSGRPADPLALDFPTVEDGARGMRFIAAALESSAAGGRWTDCRLDLD